MCAFIKKFKCYVTSVNIFLKCAYVKLFYCFDFDCIKFKFKCLIIHKNVKKFKIFMGTVICDILQKIVKKEVSTGGANIVETDLDAKQHAPH